MTDSEPRIPEDKKPVESSERKKTVTLEVLKVTRDAQNQHGLKHGDHQRYQAYCTRRIRRLRKSIGMIQSSGNKTKKNFVQKKINNQMVADASKVRKDPLRFLLIALTSAERCWAQAMVLKEESSTNRRKKYHSIRKLKKAALYARFLQNLCCREPNPCDDHTKLESQAYYNYLNGLLAFETEKWKEASKSLKTSQSLYMKLSESVEDTASAVYRQRVHELKPTLRFCAYNLGIDEEDMDAEGEVYDEKVAEANVAGDEGDTKETVKKEKEKKVIKKKPKPLHYDLALDNITFPSLEEEMAAPAQTSRGLFGGLVKGLWGLKM